MEISKLKHVDIIGDDNNLKNRADDKKQNDKPIKEVDNNALNLQANYNMAFCGNAVKTVDMQNMRVSSCKMMPYVKYKVADNACFSLHKSIIDLDSDRIRPMIQKMPKGKALIFGRDTGSGCVAPDECDGYVSATHMQIYRNKKGELIAMDLGSTNGTTILYSKKLPSSFNNYSKIKETTFLQPHKKTLIPYDCQLNLGKELTIDLRNKNIYDELYKKGKITIGRSADADFVVPRFHGCVSRKHLVLERTEYGIVATEMGSMNGTKVVPKNEIKPFMNGVKDINISQANVGDCYLLSSLYGLSLNPKGREILENMVKIDDYGNYVVEFPNKPPYIIKPHELDGQEGGDGSKKRSVSGDLGIKAIERAYGKMVKNQNNHFRPFNGNNDYRTMYMDIDDGGRPEDALEKISGFKSKLYYTGYRDMNMFFSDPKLNTDEAIMGCETPSKGNYNGYMDPYHTFPECHAYTIKNIDRFNKMVEVVDPHNTKCSKFVSFDEFDKIFSIVTIANTNQI